MRLNTFARVAALLVPLATVWATSALAEGPSLEQRYQEIRARAAAIGDTKMVARVEERLTNLRRSWSWTYEDNTTPLGERILVAEINSRDEVAFKRPYQTLPAVVIFRRWLDDGSLDLQIGTPSGPQILCDNHHRLAFRVDDGPVFNLPCERTEDPAFAWVDKPELLIAALSLTRVQRLVVAFEVHGEGRHFFTFNAAGFDPERLHRVAPRG